MTCACEVAFQIDSGFAESRSRKKWRKIEYEAENKSCEMSQENQFKVNFFLSLTDYAMYCLKDRCEQMHTVGAIFNFLYNQENL